MSDYPDYTDLMQIIGSDIQVPIDIQGAYIMLPVDIQAQYVTLDIDIVAQTVGNIAIDLAAQSVGNILVDIKAQTVGNLTVDIEAQSVAVYLTPDWNVKEGNQKSWYLFGTNLGEGEESHTDYEVPTGKALYITQASFAMYAYDVANADLNQMGFISVKESDGDPCFLQVGGNGGGVAALTAPAKFAAGTIARFLVQNQANHHVDYKATFVGYEV